MNVQQSLLVITVIAIGLSCNTATTDSQSSDDYILRIEQGRMERLARLRGPKSWLSLIGRIPLSEGINSVCTMDTCDVRLPGTEPRSIGSIIVNAGTLAMMPSEGATLFLDDGSVFPGGIIDPGNPPFIHVDALYWTFLERSGNFYFRLWDTLSPERNAIHEIPAYPVDPAWIVDVQFTPAVEGLSVILDDVQGAKRSIPVEGNVSGSWKDTSFTLIALGGDEHSLFIIIEDATTDIETYPGGRYMDIPLPDSLGRTVMDFNTAYIPPCAFTEFATCLLPPRENRLPFAVRAGEKTYGH